MGASIIAGVDTSPIFDFGEQVFDQMTLFVDRLVVVVLDLPVGLWRDARGDAARGQGIAEPVAVIAPFGEAQDRFVAQQFLGVW